MQFYSSKIQLDKKVIDDIFSEISEIKPNSKMLVFGLGYDSKMWSNATNTFFIENNDAYIKMNQSLPNIIKYEYENINLLSQKSDEELKLYSIPDAILENAPYDIILIDGPSGFSIKHPGRMIPIYWSTKLSKPGTIIYVDDSSRKAEKKFIFRFLPKPIKTFVERNQCVKIVWDQVETDQPTNLV
jgi:hypothetical protein